LTLFVQESTKILPVAAAVIELQMMVAVIVKNLQSVAIPILKFQMMVVVVGAMPCVVFEMTTASAPVAASSAIIESEVVAAATCKLLPLPWNWVVG
jgi:hypothetical protein